MLFESFSTSFNATSWPTYLSMPCEVTLKSVKKSFKNQIFPVLEQLLKGLGLSWGPSFVLGPTLFLKIPPLRAGFPPEDE
jgi:hypothetical protein